MAKSAFWTRSGLSFLICLALSSPGTAATFLVPADEPTVQAGLEAAASGDTVLVSCGTYPEHSILMKAGVTLMGESATPGCVVIDAQEQGRVLDCLDLAEPTVITNITFQGGRVSEGWLTALGGGVRCQRSQVSFFNCTFQDNSARIGAGLGASESILSLTDCTFAENTAEHFDWAAGGAVWARDCSGTMANCQVTGNTAFSTNPDNPGDGGGFFFNNSKLGVSHCVFESNSTGAGAGGFYSVTTDSSIFSFCEFINNSAANGGAVYFEYGAAAELLDCKFLGNTATAGGAIVAFNGSYPRLVDCLFENNRATLWGGGAVDCWSSNLEVERCIFRGNHAQTHGGAINLGDTSAFIDNSVFHENSAQSFGGGIRAHFADVTTTGCTLVGNSAASGAGIHCGTSSLATVARTIIAFSASGESMAGFDPGFASISCSDFYGNPGGDWVDGFGNQLGSDGNFSEDPLFCEAILGDLTLDHVSPCAPENQGACGQIGASGIGCWLSPVFQEDTRPPHITNVGNFPNPFNPSTTIHFTLASSGHTRVLVYDLAGHVLRVLVDQILPAQQHHISWDGCSEAGTPASAGVYFYRITSEGKNKSGRMALVK